MSEESSRGPIVPAHEDLLRGIVRPEWWDPDDKHLSSGVFGFPKFSAFIESKADEATLLCRFRDGSGLIKFNCGTARELGFDARHEPEEGDDAHANVYCDANRNQRKKQARKLVEATTIIKEPDIDLLKSKK